MEVLPEELANGHGKLEESRDGARLDRAVLPDIVPGELPPNFRDNEEIGEVSPHAPTDLHNERVRINVLHAGAPEPGFHGANHDIAFEDLLIGVGRRAVRVQTKQLLFVKAKDVRPGLSIVQMQAGNLKLVPEILDFIEKEVPALLPAIVQQGGVFEQQGSTI